MNATSLSSGGPSCEWSTVQRMSTTRAISAVVAAEVEPIVDVRGCMFLLFTHFGAFCRVHWTFKFGSRITEQVRDLMSARSSLC